MGSIQDIDAGPLTQSLRKAMAYVDKIAENAEATPEDRVRALVRIQEWARTRIIQIDNAAQNDTLTR